MQFRWEPSAANVPTLPQWVITLGRFFLCPTSTSPHTNRLKSRRFFTPHFSPFSFYSLKSSFELQNEFSPILVNSFLLPVRISPYNLDILSALFLSFNPNFVIFVRACFFLQRAPARCIVKFTKDDSFTNGRFKRPEKSRGGGGNSFLLCSNEIRADFLA